MSPPRVVSKVEPQYSEEARQAGLEGMVVLSVIVADDGSPRDLRVVQSLGMGLDEKALEAVAQWRFAPGMKDGKPVPVQATISVNFRLNANLSPETLSQRPAGTADQDGKPVEPAKLAAIEELFSLMKLDQLGQQMLSQYKTVFTGQLEKSVNGMLHDSPDRAKALEDLQAFNNQLFTLIADRLSYERMKPELIKLYDESFTLDELAGIAAFYKSPAGAAYLQKLPVLTAKGAEIGAKLMNEAMPEIQKMTAEWTERLKQKYGEPAAK